MLMSTAAFYFEFMMTHQCWCMLKRLVLQTAMKRNVYCLTSYYTEEVKNIDSLETGCTFPHIECLSYFLKYFFVSPLMFKNNFFWAFCLIDKIGKNFYWYLC